jgi:hypothetical protein
MSTKWVLDIDAHYNDHTSEVVAWSKHTLELKHQTSLMSSTFQAFKNVQPRLSNYIMFMLVLFGWRFSCMFIHALFNTSNMFVVYLLKLLKHITLARNAWEWKDTKQPRMWGLRTWGRETMGVWGCKDSRNPYPCKLSKFIVLGCPSHFLTNAIVFAFGTNVLWIMGQM